MTVSWNKKYDPTTVLNEMESSKKTKTDGKVTFDGFAFREFMAVTYSMLHFPKDIPENEGRAMVRNAALKLGEKGAHNP